MTRRTKISLVPCLFLAAACLSSGVAQSASTQETITISGKILGAGGKHPMYVALWDAAGFLSKPVQEVRIEPHSNAVFRFQVAPGTWAISAYEDINENGKLDMGMFGPREPNGFWLPFHQWHKPRFTEVCSKVNQDFPNADIELRK